MHRLVLTCFAATAVLLAPCAPANAWQAAPSTQATRPVELTTLIDQAKAAMMANPADALTLIAAAETLLDAGVGDRDAGSDTDLATIWWLESEALTRLGRPIDAKPVALRALAQLGAEPERTKLYADIMVSLGRINKSTSEYGLAFENFQHAYEVYRAIGDRRSESIVLQSIGSIYTDAHQYQRAVEYYDDATDRYTGDPALELAANNNLGNAYRELGQYNEALEHFERARVLAAEMGSGTLQARILNNIATLHIAFGEFEAAAQAIDTAFATIDDPVHSEWARFLWGARARIAYGRGQYRLAQSDIGHTFDGVSLDETTQSFAEYHAAAADIYQALTLWDLAVPHLRAFKRLDDEGRDVAASANTTLLAAQFDFAEQELQIEQLRTDGLERNFELANARARQRMIGLSGLLALSFFGLFLIYIRHRSSREQQRVLEKALYVDLDTGLPSRAAAERAIGDLSERERRPVTLIALGIERHKHLENALGFVKASQLKTVMAERIAEEVNVELVTLLAPDILGVLLPVPDADAALPAAEQMRRCFNTPVTLDGVEIDVAVTAGLYAGTSAETCVKNAVIALDQARESCCATAIFDAIRFGDPEQNLTLMSRMLAATRNGEMVMQYQPKLHLPTGSYLAAEALCRWTDGEHGTMSPDTFIPLAEETGHIRDFTKWALEQVVRDQHALRAAGHDITLAVNISGSLISDTDFAELALRIALQAPGRISFEVTETAAMQNAERALANLEKWAAAGIKLAIDDYGTGLSSLAYLKTLPSHELKLDRAFVTHMASSQRDRMLVKSTSDLAHGLGLEMTAEGVETLEALALLKLIGCDWAQGYVLSKAVPLAELSEFLTANPEMKNLPNMPTRAEGLAR
ncbi:EAL domain-containing protein [uncultured Maricaulis sp.]|uniref:EAL domain-containing protein n=1 Tax=uncultured Maricaulis sp. TaxID=174710 RepID=UPI0030DB6B7E|tara:strand:+ start:19647 stop:22253 length:2607 start_codon:yes stop_codon:yes gene_type:complete